MLDTGIVWQAEGLMVIGPPNEEFSDGYPIAICITPRDATHVAFALNKLEQLNQG